VETRHQHFSVKIYDVRIRSNKRLGGPVRTNKYDLATADGNGLSPGTAFICCVDGATNKDPVSAGRLGFATGWQHSDQYYGYEDVEMISIHCRIAIPLYGQNAMPDSFGSYYQSTTRCPLWCPNQDHLNSRRA